MKNKTIIFLFVAISWTLGLKAQRPMDVLDRGLVAVKTSGGVFCSWRILVKNGMMSHITSIVTASN